jgi:Protein of unknown function (DUF3037)
VRTTFDYALVRVVPRPERGEQINAGVILYCRARDFLEARIALDRARLLALDPTLDADEIGRALAVFPQVCAGQGPMGRLDLAERFHWLVAPRSTVVQVSPVHAGLCDDPAAALDHLIQTMVLPPE